MTAHPPPPTDAPSETESTPDRTAASSGPAESHEQPTVAVDDLLGLLSDEYACRILCALDRGPLSADDLVSRCEMSRPTVYRRLDRLTDAGIVDSQLSLSADGHHRQRYHLQCTGVTVQICEDGVDGRLHSPNRP